MDVTSSSGLFLSCPRAMAGYGAGDEFGDLPGVLGFDGGAVPYWGAGRQVRALDGCQLAVANTCFGTSGSDGDSGDWGEPTRACLEVVQEFLGGWGEPLPAGGLPSEDEQSLVRQMLNDALTYPSLGGLSSSEKELLPDGNASAFCRVVGVGEDSNHRVEAAANADDSIQTQGAAVAGNEYLHSEATGKPGSSSLAVLSTWLNDLSKARVAHSSKYKPKRSVRPHPYAYAQRSTGNAGRSGVVKSASSMPQQACQTPAPGQSLLQPAPSNRGVSQPHAVASFTTTPIDPNG